MRVPGASLVVVAAGLIFHIAAPAAEGRSLAAAPAVAPCAGPNDPKRAETFIPRDPLPLPTPLGGAGEKVFDEDSYRDVYGILREENPCSSFFGGPHKATEAFNEFARRLERKAVGDKEIVIRMEGSYTNYRNVQTGATYRIFERAAINSEGPFFRRDTSARPGRMRVGRFGAGTREARALTLLHELGHLVEGEAGKWLLPNDGADAQLSDRNTRRVEEKCLDQLLSLRR